MVTPPVIDTSVVPDAPSKTTLPLDGRVPVCDSRAEPSTVRLSEPPDLSARKLYNGERKTEVPLHTMLTVDTPPTKTFPAESDVTAELESNVRTTSAALGWNENDSAKLVNVDDAVIDTVFAPVSGPTMDTPTPDVVTDEAVRVMLRSLTDCEHHINPETPTSVALENATLSDAADAAK
jgi:hypothetical protein